MVLLNAKRKNHYKNNQGSTNLYKKQKEKL